jgi:hypothetical protein
MLDIATYIQENILRDRDPSLRPILLNLANEIILEVADFHKWRCLRKTDTLTLETNKEEYDLSGADQDLAQILRLRYGAQKTKVEEYDEDEFDRVIFNQITGDTPVSFVPLSRPNEYTWTVRIYPCSSTSLETIEYRYKKIIKLTDINLFSNRMVFVNGVLWRFFSNEQKALKYEDYWRMAETYAQAYFGGRELMKQHDSPTVYPQSKIVVSTDTLNFRSGVESLRGRRSR